MRVSVVIPTYNRRHIISSAIESALSQDYTEYDIVIVDDGSNDGTAELIAKVNNEKIRVVRHGQNRGYSAACNTGIKESRGDVVAFLDSDDVWEKNYLSRQVAMLSRSEVVACFTDTKIRGKRLGWDDAPGSNDSIEVDSLIGLMKSFPIALNTMADGSEHVIGPRAMRLCLLKEVPVKPSATLAYRSALIEAGCFDENAPSGTDWALFLRMTRLGGFGYINLPLVTQTRDADATHLKFRERDQIFVIEFLKKEKINSADDKEALELLNASIASRYNTLAGLYLESGQSGKAISTYWRWLRDSRQVKPVAMIPLALIPMRARRFLKKLVY